MYVEDHCKAIDLVVREGKEGEVYNVGGHNEKTNLEIVKLTISTIHRLMTEHPEYRQMLKKKVKGENGNYLVKTLENGYSVQKEGETMVMELFYDQEQSTWNVEFEGNTAELLKMNENGTAQMVLPNGEAMTVILDAQGIAAARQATMIDTYYAAR